MRNLFRNIKFSGSDITSSDLKDLNKVIKSGWLAHGEKTEVFESKFSEYTNSKYSIAVSSCTSGLYILAKLADFKKGDIVLVPSVTHTATAHAIKLTGAKVKFVDVDASNGNISVKDLKKKHSSKVKGIVIVHLLGRSAWTKEFDQFIKKVNLSVIEDCAHALGTKNFDGTHVGSKGIGGSFSFYPTKQITTGEGGMITTNSRKIYNLAKKLRAFGIDKNPSERVIPGLYDVEDLSLNFRMTEFQASLGINQITRYDSNLSHRKKIAKLYDFYLSKNNNILLPRISKDDSYFVYQFLVDKNLSRNDVILELKKNGVPVSIHYATPLHRMSYYNKENKNLNLYSSDSYTNKCISLPVHKYITNKVCIGICNIINKIL